MVVGRVLVAKVLEPLMLIAHESIGDGPEIPRVVHQSKSGLTPHSRFIGAGGPYFFGLLLSFISNLTAPWLPEVKMIN